MTKNMASAYILESLVTEKIFYNIDTSSDETFAEPTMVPITIRSAV